MTITQNIQIIRTQIENNCHACGRNPDSVLLLAVSKTKPATDIAIAYQAGIRHFGENYCQEALAKQQLLGAYAISWHFIGPIQSNKTKLIAQHFNWVHSVDNFKIARRLSEQRPDSLPPLNICLQVNISNEQSKSGVPLPELPELCAQVAALPKLRLRGVMAIPALEDCYEKQRIPYKKLMAATQSRAYPDFDTFSFGMTADLKAAITEGATVVRIGTALFGRR